MRYHPLTDDDRALMLSRIGVGSVDDLFSDVPERYRLKELLPLPASQPEMAVERSLGRLAAKNHAAGAGPFFVGAGAYRHHVPATVDHLIQRSEFLTSYTPYQAEISQGRLESLLNYQVSYMLPLCYLGLLLLTFHALFVLPPQQTVVSDLTGLPNANASLLDEGTAAGEAMSMAYELLKRKRSKFFASDAIHPQTLDLLKVPSRKPPRSHAVGQLMLSVFAAFTADPRWWFGL